MSPESPHPEPKKIDPEVFHRRVSGFSVEAQEAIATLSSVLLERDRVDKLKQDIEERGALEMHLRETGLPLVDVNYVFSYFGLPVKNDNPTSSQ